MIPASSPPPYEIAAAATAAAARLSGVRLELRWYPSLPSTMDAADQAVQAGAPEGLVILADEQTEGRGRRGRSWSSPAGTGLYVSFVLRPPLERLSGPLLSLLTLAAGVAVRDAVHTATGLAPELKWPNDVVVGRRKLAGILAEGFGLGAPAQAVVLGIGINLVAAAHPPDVAARATSLEEELGRAVDRGRLLEELLVAVLSRYDDLRRGSTDTMLLAWRRASPSAESAAVEWQAPDGPRRGVTAGIDATGALLVRTPAGTERIVAGELTWLA